MKSFFDGRIILHEGDCRGILKTIPDCSIDSVCCDPPYHLTSIVKRFGGANSAPAQFGEDGAFKRASTGFMGKQWDGGDIAQDVALWAEVLRVLKPGGYIVAFSSSRTYHRMACAIEDAGFITHPMIGWITGQGFPKAHKVELDGWEGWRYGTQSMKPALEPIYMGQKPFSEATGSSNVARWGTGAINVDGCRIEVSANDPNHCGPSVPYKNGIALPTGTSKGRPVENLNSNGRWPANLILDSSPEVLAGFPYSKSSGGDGYKESMFCGGKPTGGHGLGDDGSAARFFYCAKASASDRVYSRHPTVKPVALIRWLIRLITPPNGTCLDMFAGTGTTGEAAVHEGFKAILVERESEYCDDIKRRMDLAFAPKDQRTMKQGSDMDWLLEDIVDAAE